MPSRILVTGANGLIGSHIARALLARGDEVRVTVRARSRTENLDTLEVERATCDVTDRRAVRRALKGIERVYHCAGITSIRASRERLDRANVEGTRTVLEECLRAGVERVVYTSSVAAIGPAPAGGLADESQPFPPWAAGVPYVDSKREAETIALRLGAQGLPVVIVNPSHVLGAGDVNRSSTDIVRRFLRRQIPAYVDGALNVVGADDVARGHLAAERRGALGERYILANRNYTLERLFADLGRLSGVEAPAVKLPVGLALALARAGEALPLRTPVTSGEIRAVSMRWAYSNEKARRKLRWRPGPHERALVETIEWYREREGERISAAGARQPLALRAGGEALRRVGRLAGGLR